MVFPNLGAKDGFSESASGISRELFSGMFRQGKHLASIYRSNVQNASPGPHRCHLIIVSSFRHELMHKDEWLSLCALIDIFFANANIRSGLNNAALRAVFYFRNMGNAA